MWYVSSKEKDEQLVEICEVPFKAISNKLQQSFQIFHGPIIDGLDGECNQNFSSLTNNQIQDQDDKGYISQTFQSEKILSQSLFENMEGYKGESDISISWPGCHLQQMYNCLNQFKNNMSRTSR